jgi:hypothetical protein
MRKDGPSEIRWRDPPGLHTLSSAGANAEEDENSRLPAPEQFLLSKHDQFSLEIEVGKYITFVQRTLDGSRDVTEKFTLHYLKLRGSAAPRVHAVLTLSIVLPDRTLLAENGIDRERKVAFRIDRTLLRWIPKREDCTPKAIRAAYRFLTEEWLIDVLTDRKGKATLIAYALSIIERCLIPNRPVFTVTAGQRGGGKTTVLMMIILAVLGIKPAAAAWSSDPTERKKALFAYLLEGLPALVWDNIPRGAVISCPSIERSCTAEGYSDRILGITGISQADAYTIQAFTGNCIRCASDLASRNLTVTITTDRPDPENRTFVHSDPLAWHWIIAVRSFTLYLWSSWRLEAPWTKGRDSRNGNGSSVRRWSLRRTSVKATMRPLTTGLFFKRCSASSRRRSPTQMLLKPRSRKAASSTRPRFSRRKRQQARNRGWRADTGGTREFAFLAHNQGRESPDDEIHPKSFKQH